MTELLFSRDESETPGVGFSVNEVIESSLKIIGTQLKNHGILVRLELDDVLQSVRGHPHQLEQVILNLLANARDAVNAKGNPDKTVRIRTRMDGKDVVAEVEDNGVGIAEADAQRLFEPFFTTKEADRGTGLGLSISYAIVKNHGGEIGCESRKGEGATFRVVLPAESLSGKV